MSNPRTILDYLQLAAGFLGQKGVESARLDAEVLLGHVLGKDRVFLYVHFDQPLEPPEVSEYRALIARRGRREPLAYIIGHKEFYSRAFHLTADVLIPRPETELLIDTVVGWATERPASLIVDVGTGSGAIAITLALELQQARFVAIDTSPQALAVAQRNAHVHAVEGRIRFELGEWLQPVAECQVDAVVSNPPYIPRQTIVTLQPEVSRYEPRLALDGGADGLDAYRILTRAASHIVRPGGALFLEVGHDQAPAVVQLGRQAGWKCEAIVKDHANIDRVVVFQRGEAS